MRDRNGGRGQRNKEETDEGEGRGVRIDKSSVGMMVRYIICKGSNWASLHSNDSIHTDQLAAPVQAVCVCGGRGYARSAGCSVQRAGRGLIAVSCM